MDDLNAAKSVALGEARKLLVGRMSFEFYFDFFEMLKTNNELVAAGHIITDENREQKYLEIVNLEDEALLDKLKKYLDTSDRIGAHLMYYEQYKKLKDVMESVTKLEEVTGALDEFKAMFS